MKSSSRTLEKHASRDAYRARAERAHLAPLWGFFKDWFTAEPRTTAVPYLWRFDELRALILEGASVVSAAEAERRVLALDNPALAGKHLATDTLYAGLQSLFPGETAPLHRHSPAALRFVIEGRGSYTTVEGERHDMEPGDLIITPSWTWHEHANDGDSPTIWLDVLDVALVRFLGTSFFEPHRETKLDARTPLDGDDPHARNTPSLADRRTTPSGSPVFGYPFSRARETLDRLKAERDSDPWHGVRFEYIDPIDGGPAVPTISTFMQLVPAGFTTQPYQSTAGAIYSVVAGRGRATIGAGEARIELRYGPRDLFVVPGWQPLALAADEESILFSASDQAAQRKLGLWRERRESVREA